MHLVHPSLSMTGKSKKKAQFRNADEARKSRENKDRWASIKEAHGIADEKKRTRGLAAKTWSPPALSYRGSDQPRIPSLDTGFGNAAKADIKVYTGDKMLGIATMHKSNSVPVFSAEEAEDISKMRRG